MQPQQYAPQYPVQQPTYPPQFPTMPQGYAPPAPQPNYPPQYVQQPVYQQAPVYAPPQPAAPQVPTAPGSIDAFYAQPSTGGGKAWAFQNKPNGTSYIGRVARPVTNADIQQQTDMKTGIPRTYRDGRPMFVMVVPMHVEPSPEFPDGQAAWWVRGQSRDELARAMAEAGAPEGPPEAGAIIRVTKTGERPNRSGNPTYQYRVEYVRPANAGEAPQPLPQPVAAPVQQPEPVRPGAGAYPPVGDQLAAAYQAPQPAGYPAHYVPAGQQQPVAQPMQAPQVQQPPMAVPADFNPEQAALLAQLTGQRQ